MTQLPTKNNLGSNFEVYGDWLHNEMSANTPLSQRVDGGTFRITLTAMTPQDAIDWVIRTLGVDIRVMGATQL